MMHVELVPFLFFTIYSKMSGLGHLKVDLSTCKGSSDENSSSGKRTSFPIDVGFNSHIDQSLQGERSRGYNMRASVGNGGQATIAMVPDIQKAGVLGADDIPPFSSKKHRHMCRKSRRRGDLLRTSPKPFKKFFLLAVKNLFAVMNFLTVKYLHFARTFRSATVASSSKRRFKRRINTPKSWFEDLTHVYCRAKAIPQLQPSSISAAGGTYL
jgi:hypothetical protein